jgi:sulfide dehydrogenase [flavocytochrome c] flavoprotein subunit
MADGGTVLVCPPVKPFRAGSGPYERVSLIAHYLKQNKPNSKIIIVDASPSFSMQAGFEQGWSTLYGYGAGSMIEWRPDDAVVAVDAVNRTVTTAGGSTVQGDVVNLIPPQQAGSIAFAAGLTDDSGWCPVNKRTFESLQVPNVHVIGDAAIASGLPKSAYAANVEGKACAAAIVALLNGQQPGTPAFAAAAYGIIGADYAISSVSVYQVSADGSSIDAIAGAGGATALDASAEDQRREVEYARSWYNNIVKDVFG